MCMCCVQKLPSIASASAPLFWNFGATPHPLESKLIKIYVGTERKEGSHKDHRLLKTRRKKIGAPSNKSLEVD